MRSVVDAQRAIRWTACVITATQSVGHNLEISSLRDGLWSTVDYTRYIMSAILYSASHVVTNTCITADLYDNLSLFLFWTVSRYTLAQRRHTVYDHVNARNRVTDRLT